MKHIAIALLAALLLAPVAAAEEAAPTKPRVVIEYRFLAVGGVENGEQAAAVRATLARVPGVRSATWTKGRTEIKVMRIQGRASDQLLISRVTASGHTAKTLVVKETRFTFEAPLHCNGCAATVRKKLEAIAATKEVIIPKDRAWVRILHAPSENIADTYRSTLNEAGYPVV